MASKRKGKGKGKGKEIFIDYNAEKNKLIPINQYEGALDFQYYVLAQMRNGQKAKAKIIECRFSKEDYDPKKTKNDYSYDYYLHFEGYNRRNDQWQIRENIELTTEIIQEAQIKKKRKGEEQKQEKEENDEHEGMDEASLQAHLLATKIKTIEKIQIGKHSCETWYYSPFPKGYHNVETIYVCEFCLNFYLTQSELDRHSKNCKLTHPPGDEIYRDDNRKVPISIFEVDGKYNGVYAENLGYLSKLFLDHKNLYYNLDPFLIYILTENDEQGSHIVGYFSKWKECPHGYNLSCILVFPCHQRKGYGKFLISISYQLSIIEGKPGTPERPLSDLGKVSYLSWWSQTIIDFLRKKADDYHFSISDITKETGIQEKDIIWTLEQKNMVKYAQGQIIICTDMNYLNKVYKECGQAGIPVYPENFRWVPFRFKWDKEVQIFYPKYNPKLISENNEEENNANKSNN
ncbi:hypothetical protein IMG5_024310 [Ichthyophthirius multifiliis]|uniref:Histone acetyltransferase n=1 Tax=Ichthyophthirius multifiliis TaxID=5932 RepID=G0QL13_ICHMU|nr:hypothetical protein IMG5_024310 [Ichthyophthirius multifiliis]EGR34092.1 hypothetical protein IMG5_024310 [Ichthyophthirius multifiliis]|eukprot:XP_004039396.1 hypothetical protein IMG5_024310 [Ichthyophthirius multifiliis]